MSEATGLYYDVCRIQNIACCIERLPPSLPSDTTTGPDELSSRITVGIIVGIAGIATILIMLVLYAMMICKYCFYKRNKRHLRTAGGVTLYGGGSGYYYGSSTGTGTFTKEFSRQDSYNMSPRTRGYSASGVSQYSYLHIRTLHIILYFFPLTVRYISCVIYRQLTDIPFT